MYMFGSSNVRLEVPLRGEKMLKISTLVKKEASRITLCFLRNYSGLFFLAMNFKFKFTVKTGFISLSSHFKKKKVLFLSDWENLKSGTEYNLQIKKMHILSKIAYSRQVLNSN